MDTKLILSAAIFGMLAATSVVTQVSAQEAAAKKQKCYGVAKKGMNDCGTATHSCAGKATADNMVEEWKYVKSGTCKKMGGGLTVADATEAMKKKEMKMKKDKPMADKPMMKDEKMAPKQ
jgi:uncharacterized membrane protein